MNCRRHDHHEKGTGWSFESDAFEQYGVSEPVRSAGVPEPLWHGTKRSSVRVGHLQLGEKLAPAARLGYTPDDFFETGHVYTNAVTVSGGTDKNQTYFSTAARETPKRVLIS